MNFYNREKEKQRLNKALQSDKAKLIVIYGRRRCGKSTLIRNVIGPDDVYFMAQQADESIQLAQLASAISEKVAGFDSVVYPNWESLFINLNNVVKQTITICIDEFPYLVKNSTGLPSVIQKITDNYPDRKYHLILCGSSQQMMHGLILDSSAPLYGRANEILKVTPLEAGWIDEALECNAEQAVIEYSVWGGVPRYWELRKEDESLESALKNIILDRYGVLHEEPSRLFLDDMREFVQAYSILTVVGNGCNRLSEIASRTNKPANQLSRPIENLIQLGYLKREVPFGEHLKNSKKGLYRIADPFMNFYFTFVAPNLSRLELNLTDQVYSIFAAKISMFVAAEWENLCRRCIPMQPVQGINFDIAYRWWGANSENKPMEIDVIAESLDKRFLLVGECKWSIIGDVSKLVEDLTHKAGLLPFAKDKIIIPVVFLKEKGPKGGNIGIMLPSDVMGRLKI
jgi:AAA+ ATPase superfamily predicted ATPase